MKLTSSTYSVEDDSLYYLEFSQWEGSPLRWTLFQRQYMYPPEEWAKMEHGILDSNEVHPWNLGEGIVNERDVAMDLNTRWFLKFMVDALNEKVISDKNKKEMNDAYEKRQKYQTDANNFKKDVDTYIRERDGY